jgi:hypothetical protein
LPEEGPIHHPPFNGKRLTLNLFAPAWKRLAPKNGLDARIAKIGVFKWGRRVMAAALG